MKASIGLHPTHSSILFLLSSTFYFLFLQRIQPLHQPLERAFGSFDGCGVGETNPFAAEGREERTRDNRDSMIFGEILTEGFCVHPAFGLEIFSYIDEGVISLANDMLEFISQKQVFQCDAAGVGWLDDGFGSFGESHFVGCPGNGARLKCW